jgi:two-component system sensor histidine kinase DegS
MDKPVLPVFDATDHGIRLLEEERRRIARDLHDGPAQVLTNISMKLDVLRTMIETNPEMAKALASQLHKRVTDVTHEIRALIYDLRPIAVDEVGLIEAAKELCVQYEKNWNVHVLFEVEDGLVSNGIAPAKQVALYRLIQEVLNNIKKHAKANTIKVAFSHHGTELVITIQDDGVGFNPNDIPPGHYGLIGMKERAAYLGGQLDIDSVIGQGSTFVIRVPVYNG